MGTILFVVLWGVAFGGAGTSHTDGIISPTLITFIKKQEAVHTMNSPRLILHVIERMNSMNMEVAMLSMHKTRLKSLIRKYHDETRRLMKGFLDSPIKADSSVSVIRLVLFHLENNPAQMLFYSVRREKRMLLKLISSYKEALEWLDRKSSLDKIIKLYGEVRVMIDIIRRAEEFDYTKPLTPEEKEIVRIAVERIKKVVSDSKDGSEVAMGLMDYTIDYMKSGQRDRLPNIFLLWSEYKRSHNIPFV
jgi:hypothetical protein